MIDLSTAELLATSSRAERARKLLVGEVGPLQAVPDAAFSVEVAGMAYFLHLAWQRGRKVDMLGKIAVYEARDRFGARVRAEMARAGKPMDFAVGLLRKLGSNLDSISPEDTVWLRTWTASVAGTWWRLQERTALEEAITAAHLVGDWLWRVHEILADTDPIDTDTGASQ